jgi:nitric oxide reductase subunit B
MKRLWIAFATVLVISFSILLWAGASIYQKAPPIADRVVTPAGREVIGSGAIARGQNVWQALGGMEVGSIWGHGSYVAPDWTADSLHRELLFVLDVRKAAAPNAGDADLRDALQREYRKNTFDASTNTLVISEDRAAAFEANAAHYADVFLHGRNEYAIQSGALSDPVKARELAGFFFWSAWAAATERPDEKITYTSNWPHEPLIGNVPTSDSIVWTGVSILLLLAGIGGMAFFHAASRRSAEKSKFPEVDPLLGASPTPSQRATIKFFWVVAGLMLLQIGLGIITAHYGVEGDGFYGIPLAKILPYSVTRTWHTQLGIFWIATAWLGAGLAIAPSVGREPKGQALLVNVLFGALVLVVLGSMAGEWMSVHGLLEGDAWFWFGHSGYEYVDLGRIFQVGLFVGLLLWCFLVVRAIAPALKQKSTQRPVLVMFLISTVAIAGFYGAVFGVGRHTNLAVAEYWRWWVVHLWVEGFFEVFATVVIAFLLARLGLVEMRSASRATVLTATIFLGGGVVGTLHHLYFTGTPTQVLALGSAFSALEVVPLVFVGHEAWENLRLTKATAWMRQYRWPIYFFIAVAFWNLVGAGIFGFMINPPVALYYMQGLNTTPVHGHAALFGVYGMLGIGLVLFTICSIRPKSLWPERTLSFAFWAINGGLMAMVVLSLLPVGLLQTYASIESGYWFARSAEFLQTPLMSKLRWMRVFGDTLFTAGAVAFVIVVVRMTLSKITAPETRAVPNAPITGATGIARSRH